MLFRSNERAAMYILQYVVTAASLTRLISPLLHPYHVLELRARGGGLSAGNSNSSAANSADGKASRDMKDLSRLYSRGG